MKTRHTRRWDKRFVRKIALLSVMAVSLTVAAQHTLHASDTEPKSDAGKSSDGKSTVVASGATLRLIADGYKFTEGPAVDSAGNVYFTDQPNDRILRYDTTPGQANAKRMTVWMSPCGRSNGLFFANDQTLIACADEKNQLWSIPIVDGRPGPPVVLVDDYQEQLLNGPNDCWVSADGAIYFTDPFYKRPYWQRGPSQQDAACVYRYDPESKAVKRVADGFRQPNGIVGNPETGVVFIADIGDQKTYRFKIDREGNLTQRKLFCNSGSDGMTLDEKGNLYLTGNPGVMVFNAEGQRIDTIAVPQSWTANVTFGGPERKTLFVTAKSGLYAIETKFRGL